MSIQLQLRRGTAAEHTTFTGAQGELTFDSTNNTIRAHDGSTAGGRRLALSSDLTNFVTTSNNHDIPAGGAIGQILMKSSASDYDVAWVYPRAATITTITGTTYTLALTDQYVRATNTGATVITIPTNASVAFPIGTQITIVRAAGTGLTFSNSGVTVVASDGTSLRKTGSAATLTKVATDTWDFSGDVVIT